jgi:site-specific recombinase XerD
VSSPAIKGEISFWRLANGAGQRVSEVVALKVSDINSARMTMPIEQGKGRKDRYVMLSRQRVSSKPQGE